MKQFSKFIILFLAIVCLTCFSCKKEKYMNNGIITGFDTRACPCCGGLLINFKGETESFKGEFYLIQNSPYELGINNNSTFPVYIQVDWTSVGCIRGALGNLIKITRFKKL
jgi:hypothetical protein